ncbi:glutamate-rich protein 6-like isoform X1 [Alosa sapidissima]|uniref:glutamate-rich protein 6-like isoform X1 n=1 Tax=Alosa sapidissima TaxID=34773 RepID=UPI001C08308C|nr:glutamate-rich protein 6-like isoform X1 [Alosa sapidissima]
MSKKSGSENDKPSGTSPRRVENPSLELTVENVQRLEKELKGLDKLYGSSQSIEGYVKTTEYFGRTPQISRKASREGHRSLSRNSSSGTSPECVDILGLDGTVITRISRSTQTEWNWVSQKHKNSLCSQTEEYVVNHEKTPVEHEDHKGPDSEETAEMEIMEDNEETVTKSRDSQVPPQLEHLTGEFDKITVLTSSSDSSVKLPECELASLLCEYCRRGKKPPVTREQLEKMTDPEELFCCEVAWRMADLEEQEEEETEKASKSVQENRKINDVDPRPLLTESKERLAHMLREWVSIRSQDSHYPSGFYTRERSSGDKMVPKNTICYRLSNDLWNIQEESQLPEMEIITPPETLNLPDREPGVKRTNILVRYYRNGKTFVLIFPDGTGHVFYPSGRIAVLISSVHPGHFIYIILEDAPLLPRIQAIFTSRGQATCYHPNGLVCVNLTRVGGTWCSESGALKRCWSWLDLSAHVHAPPFQPINMMLSPRISIRICTQENIYLAFTAGKNSVRFNMGTKLKVGNSKGLMWPGPDILESYLHKRSVQISSLLQKLQGSVSFKRPEPGQVSSQYSLRAQGKKRKEQAKNRKASKPKLPHILTKMARLIA